jgi:hypothetical protein
VFPQAVGAPKPWQAAAAVYITITLHKTTLTYLRVRATNNPEVTTRERADETSLDVPRHRLMGLPRRPYVSTLAGTRVLRVRMALIRSVFDPVPKQQRGVTRQTGGGIVNRAARL